MKELKCPNCGKVFSVDESEYATIVNQVRTLSLRKTYTVVLKNSPKRKTQNETTPCLRRSLIFKSNLASKKQS